FHATLAADYWLLAGDSDAAVAIAMQGLSLGSEVTPERTALIVRLERAEAAQSKVNRMERIDEQR
ncbi:MAG: hypothetical protein H0V89_01180, partial [Deltaproteobacteria bacterium]|nr:hypothetical protein [Deltaproteobacteria bacterium]